MEKNYIKHPEIKLVGISVRTNNKNEFDPIKAKIFHMIEKYFSEKVSEKILNRRNPGITYCCYTDYENDMNGDYTYFIGEEVVNFSDKITELGKLVIPEQNYVRFTNSPGKIPDVCIKMWQKIWKTSDEDLGGSRNYKTDFELYDERSKDKMNAILDIYIGISR